MSHCPGQVRCGKIVRGQPHPRLSGYTNIIVVAFNKKWGQLSPMKLGPPSIVEELCPLFPDGICPGFMPHGKKQITVCRNVENTWQYSKIYDVDVDKGVVQASFFNRRAEGFASPIAKRRVFPKASGIQTVATYHGGRILGYVDSRVYYCHYYAYLAERHPI